MCFKNLPIEFDENGKARLLETAGDPYGTSENPVKQYVHISADNGGSSTSAGSAASTTPPRLSGWGTN